MINWDELPIKELKEAEKIHLEFIKTAEKVLEALAGQESIGLSEKQISKRAKARKQRLVKTLRKLVQIKSLKRVGKGTKKDPYHYLYFREPEKDMQSSQKSLGTSNQPTIKNAGFTPSTLTPTVKK
ncbi:TPA: hypothetical protein DCG61_01360 [Patescibacteria group bacterium]|nr:hypothetical protein [Patescibacteria group bacterium]